MTTQHNPTWYKDAIIYELHIKSFFDSNDDGIGDFKGLIQKLDYLQELGITAVWLLPFYPSPLLDDGYDISNYFDINPEYGRLADFKRFLKEAHQRNIRVITEMVINHTSDQHKWFQRARRAKPGTVSRDYYVWSDSSEKYRDVRIIFTDTESSNWTWDPLAQAYYWHRFFSHQPDLNFDNPKVQKEIIRALDFWFKLGVDGMRLDAIPYLFEREGTNCENLPETHDFLKKLRRHVDTNYPDKMLLAEANQWPEDASQYFGDGDECHMCFHFPVMPRLFMAIRMEDRFPIIDILEQSMDIPESCQWAMFLRNHDELTLEMVTDEERDYMYKAYAQDPRARINIGIRRRLAPLMDKNYRRIELLNSLLFSLPGTPIIYYGDEIGMGDNYYLGDRDGVRTPMQWSADRNAGFSRANPQRLYLPVIIDSEYHFTTVNVENQNLNLSSMLWFMRRIIAIRKRFKAFGRGSIEFINSDNTKVLTFIRRFEDETLLIAANLSRYCQSAHLPLKDYVHYEVEELFGGNAFPEITDQPYRLTLSPHTFFWFSLKHKQEPVKNEETFDTLTLNVTWDKLFARGLNEQLAGVLSKYISHCRWFAGKGKTIRGVSLVDYDSVPAGDQKVHLLLIQVTFTSGPRQVYFLPLSFAGGKESLYIHNENPAYVICPLKLKNAEGILYESIVSQAFQEYLLKMFLRPHSRKSHALRAKKARGFQKIYGENTFPIPSELLKAEQSNSSIVYKDTFFLKLYRRLDEGINPDVELSEYLTERTHFSNLSAYAGAFEWHRDRKPTISIGVLLEWVHSDNNAWNYTLDSIERYLHQSLVHKEQNGDILQTAQSIEEFEKESVPLEIRDLIGGMYLDHAELLGRRTAELHKALASLKVNKNVMAENFSLLYQKSLYQSIRSLILGVFRELGSGAAQPGSPLSEELDQLINNKKVILDYVRRITKKRISTSKIRIHGDLHLGQILYTGKDFVFIDFEGEPARTISERRLKYSPLRDVAGMIRSFHYAAYGCIFQRMLKQGIEAEKLYPWAELWYLTVGGIYLRNYRDTLQNTGIIPDDDEDFALLLKTFLIEKAVYELGYELNNRPDWLVIPLRGLDNLLKGEIGHSE